MQKRTRLILLMVAFLSTLWLSPGHAAAARYQEPQDQKRRLYVPNRGRRVEQDRVRHRGIGHAYKHAGISAGRGAKRFGKYLARGRVLKAGKEFGKGMGGFGKGVGIGTARTGKKTARAIRHAFTS